MAQDPQEQRAIVQRMIDAGESEENIATVIRHFNNKPSVQSAPASRVTAPMFGHNLDAPPDLGPQDRREWADATIQGAMAGLSPAAAIATGGASLPVQFGAQAAVGALTGGVRDGVRGAVKDAASNVATQGAGLGIMAGLKKLAPTIMEGALRMSAPIRRKFGELGQWAVDNRVMPTQAGADKADRLRRAAQAEKLFGLYQADKKASVLTAPIVSSAEASVAKDARGEFLAGLRKSPTGFDAMDAFRRNSGPGISPSDLDAAKHAWDDATNAAHRAVEVGRPVTTDDKVMKHAAREAGNSLERVLPGYRRLNREIMNAEGARQAAQGRVDIPARGLDNLAAAYSPSPYRLAARVARIPRAMGAAAIATDAAAPMAPVASHLTREAILSLLRGSRQ